MKMAVRILIILLTAGVISAGAYALVQSGLVSVAGPGREGDLWGRDRRPPATLQRPLAEGGAFEREGQHFDGRDFGREGREGIHISARTWATWSKNLGIIAVMTLGIGLVNWIATRRRTRPRRATLDASSGAA